MSGSRGQRAHSVNEILRETEELRQLRRSPEQLGIAVLKVPVARAQVPIGSWCRDLANIRKAFLADKATISCKLV